MHRLASITNRSVRRWLLPWLLAFSALLNLAYPTYLHYDFSHSLDTRTYLRVAAGRFDSTSVTRRYRILVPAAAALVAVPISEVYAHVWPQRSAGQWPLRLAFYLVNCSILALAAGCWFNAARHSGATPQAAALAMLAVLTSRWATYAAGLPLTDSLYLLVVSLGYYAHRRGSGAGWALGLAFLLGPLAKESFLLLLPWLFWYGRQALPWQRRLAAASTGVLLLVGIHSVVDAQLNASVSSSITNATNHSQNIGYSLRRAFSVKGVGELFSIFGLFTLVVPISLSSFLKNTSVNFNIKKINHFQAEFFFLLTIIVHMLLSSDLGRMGYLASPAFATFLALYLSRIFRLVTN